MDRPFARAVSERLEDGRAFAVATVVAARGSVPGKVGFQMLVDPDGTSLGTVGGAGLEERVRAAAREAASTGESGLVEFSLSYLKEGGLDSVCGGVVSVFIHAVARKPHLLLVGGGHVGHAVARQCDALDWLHSVLDDRPEYASPQRFPHARGRHVLPADRLDGEVDPARFTHALVAGYSFRKDIEVLAWLLPRFEGHVGLIGSAMRRREFLRRLKGRGVPEERLARIECPVGLPIGARTPAEIAVSIVAGFLRGDRVRDPVPASYLPVGAAPPTS